MPRNSSGVYTLPAKNPVAPNTVIETGWANPTMTDLGSALTDSLSRSGSGSMLNFLKIIDGTAVQPGLAFNAESSTGLYRPTASTLGVTVTGVPIATFDTTKVTLLKPIALADDLVLADNKSIKWGDGSVGIGGNSSSGVIALSGIEVRSTSPLRIGGAVYGPLGLRDGGVYGGTGPDSRFDGIVVESAGNTGLTFLTPSAQAGIVFGRPSVPVAGGILYDHNAESMNFFAGTGASPFSVTAGYLNAAVPIRANGGTVSAPGYGFSADSGTGFVLAGAGTVAYSGSGAEQMRITTGGVMYLGGNVNGILAIQNSAQLLYILGGPVSSLSNCAQLVLAGPTFVQPRAAILRSDSTQFTNATGGLEYARFIPSGQFLVGTTASFLYGSTGHGEIDINGTSDASLAFGVGGALKGYFYIDASNTSFNNITAAGGIYLQIASTPKLIITSTQLLDYVNGGLELGWRDLPVVTVNAYTTLTRAHRGKCVIQTAVQGMVTQAGFVQGDIICICNKCGAPISLGTTGITLTWGTGSGVLTGARTLASNAMATLFFTANDVGMLTGTGIT